MKKSISLTSALSMLALMLVSCSSGTTASTTRQTTATVATTADHALPSQSIGYRDNNMETDYGGISAMGR
jgi:PBP1b-binding outer membrane lipoprotein LpoB